jgi:hypothetical protein
VAPAAHAEMFGVCDTAPDHLVDHAVAVRPVEHAHSQRRGMGELVAAALAFRFFMLVHLSLSASVRAHSLPR